MTIRNPQRLLDPNIRWVTTDGRLTSEAYQYLREVDEALRQLIAASNDHETRIAALETP